ncbi:helix-turn-helix domain-containing protein [Acidaminococcus timonensis]|uniref:helix-turn-helix domain-containing protein n=1 Tax=Acidaminococcus timonensis TaxID=1871002 RepID=UPI0008D9BBE4|nr:helix-turn-helix domain-containing protein [Acidaminococcus timonensis]
METIDARVAILEQRVKNLEAQLHGPVFGAALPSVLDIEALMNALDCSEYRAREIMKSGRLKVFRIGKKYLATREHFLEWLEQGGDAGGQRNGQ